MKQENLKTIQEAVWKWPAGLTFEEMEFARKLLMEDGTLA